MKNIVKANVACNFLYKKGTKKNEIHTNLCYQNIYYLVYLWRIMRCALNEKKTEQRV